jgi:hypothetical protein
VVDTTGAGDIFRAGFIYGLLQEWPLDRLLDFSCAAAALNCMAAGARGGIKTVAAVENLMATVSRYEDGLKVPVLEVPVLGVPVLGVPVLDEQRVDRVSR